MGHNAHLSNLIPKLIFNRFFFNLCSHEKVWPDYGLNITLNGQDIAELVFTRPCCSGEGHKVMVWNERSSIKKYTPYESSTLYSSKDVE